MSDSQPVKPRKGINGSTSRRPATTGKAALTAKSSLKARASLSSMTNRTPVSLDNPVETSKDVASDKQMSTTSIRRSTSPTKASIGRRSHPGPTTNVENKPAPDRSSTTSPNKAATKATTPNARPSNTSSPRSTRPVRYPPRPSSRSVAPNSNPTSTALSSGPKGSPSSIPLEQPAQNMTKKLRPALGPRKSTMSVTIEQRLREMSLVSTMLRAAMAEDGADDDDVKEEYGNQADEDLALLRSKLEESRRNEGKELLNIKDNVDLPVTKESEDVAKMKAMLEEKAKELKALQEQLIASREQISNFREFHKESEESNANPEAPVEGHQDCLARFDEAALQHGWELETANIRIENLQERIDELSEKSLSDMEELKKKLTAEASARVDRLLKQQLDCHEQEKVELNAKLDEERHEKKKVSDRAERLAWELVDLKNSFDERQAQNAQLLEDMNTRHHVALDAKDLEINQFRLDLRLLQNELDSSKAEAATAASRDHAFQAEFHDRLRKVRDLELAAERQMSEFRNSLESYAKRIHQLEDEAKAASRRRSNVRRQDAQERSRMQSAHDSLLNEILREREIHKQELEDLRLHLTRDHDAELQRSLRAAEDARNARDEAIGFQEYHERRRKEAEDELKASSEALAKTKQSLAWTEKDCTKVEKDLELARADMKNMAEATSEKDAKCEDLVARLAMAVDSEAQMKQDRHQMMAEIHSLQAEIKSLKSQNAEMEDKITSSGNMSMQYAERARNAESELDTARAQLIELQDHSDHHDKTPSDEAKTRSAQAETILSRVQKAWNKPLGQTPMNGESTKDGEFANPSPINTERSSSPLDESEDFKDLGAVILGRVASIQTQLKTMFDTNEYWVEDQRRIVQKMASLYRPEPSPRMWPDEPDSPSRVQDDADETTDDLGPEDIDRIVEAWI